jgi:hypothetical protein
MKATVDPPFPASHSDANHPKNNSLSHADAQSGDSDCMETRAEQPSKALQVAAHNCLTRQRELTSLQQNPRQWFVRRDGKNIGILRNAVRARPAMAVTIFDLFMSAMKFSIMHLPEFIHWGAEQGLGFPFTLL